MVRDGLGLTTADGWEPYSRGVRAQPFVIARARIWSLRNGNVRIGRRLCE